jgi:hypothetical protein
MPSLGADKASGVRQILFVQGNFRIVLGAFLERMSHFSALVAAFLATGFGAIVGGMTRLSAFEAGNVAIPLLLEFLVAAIPSNLCVFRLAFFVSHFLLWFAIIVASGFSVLGHCEIKQRSEKAREFWLYVRRLLCVMSVCKMDHPFVLNTRSFGSVTEFESVAIEKVISRMSLLAWGQAAKRRPTQR